MSLDIAELEAASAFWENAGYVATSIVIVGVIGEAVADLTNWIKKERHKQLVERASVLLLIAGLAAEIFSQVQSNNKNSLIVGILNERAGNAEEAAAEARERAAKAELALAKMNAPRVISGPDFTKLMNSLRPYAGKTFWVIVERNEPDAAGEQQDLGNQIERLFTVAGWKKDSHWSQLDETKVDPDHGPVSDRGCQIAFSTKSGALGNFVLNGLRDAEIECVSFASDEIKPDHVIVTIGLR